MVRGGVKCVWRWRRREVACWLVMLACGVLAGDDGFAQAGMGAVSGHVTFAESNLPARLASVVLVPAVEAVPKEPKDGEKPAPTTTKTVVQTLLDGSFAIGGVQPGSYYVVAEEPGYLSPLSEFTREQINKSDEATAKKTGELMPLVTISAGHTTTSELRIYRAGSISGTVRFDDGSPFGGANVWLMAKDKDGKWKTFQVSRLRFGGGEASDDEGHYRLTGIPPGEYLVGTRINLISVMLTNLFGPTNMMSSYSGNALAIYAPNVVREKDARSVKLGDGEAVGSVNIEVPVSTMHTISGAIVDAAGIPVNAGEVFLEYADDGTEIESAEVSKEDSQFHFNFVPEGSYTLKAKKAREVTREKTMNPPGDMPPSTTKETTVRSYKEGSMPLVVHGDLSGVLVKVEAKPAS